MMQGPGVCWRALIGLGLLLAGGVSKAEDGARLPGEVPLFAPQTPVWPVPSDAPLNGQLDSIRSQALFNLQQLADVCSVRGAQASQQAAQSAWVLGLIRLHGKAGAADPVSAAVLFSDAWRCGFPLASAGLAWCAMDGCGQTPSVAQARRWIDPLLRVNPGRALYLRWWLDSRLAPLTAGRGSNGAGRNGVSDPAELRRLLLQSAGLGDAQALNELGMEALAANRLDEAETRFAAAAARSDAARFNLTVAQARCQWQRLLDQAARSGDSAKNDLPPAAPQADVWLALARRYHRGSGVVADYRLALTYYQRAAAAGSAAARRMLALIYSRPAADGGVDPTWMTQLARLDIGGAHAGSLDGLLPEPARQVRRDPSPLHDFLPQMWRH